MRSAAGMSAVLILLAVLAAGCASQSLGGRQAAANLLANSSIAGIMDGIRTGRFTCEDIISEQLRRIDKYNATFKAFIALNRESALDKAKDKDRSGISGGLHCVPVVVKDNMDLQGLPTTSGARALLNMTAAQDSNVVARIKAMGGIIIGKSNMAEMSDSGTKSESTLGGVCANPWDIRRSCLGSSGGSSAAVAAGLAVIGLGTDTEGSVIGPCAASGLLCLRPTQGGEFLTMRAGVYPAFEHQDLVGIMAKSSADYLTTHDAIYGVDYSTTVGTVTSLSGRKIRFLDNFYENIPLGPDETYTPDPEMVRLHNMAAQRLTSLGAEVERYNISLAELQEKFGIILSATATKTACSTSCMKKSLDAYLSRYPANAPFRTASDLLAVSWGFPTIYQQKLNASVSQPAGDVCGTAACNAYDIARANISSILLELLSNASALAVPFTAKLPQLNNENPGLADQITPALNPYTGWPSVALPVGFASSSGSEQPQGLPVSLVLLAPASQEPQLLGIANAYLARFADIRTPASAPALTVGAEAARGCGGLVAVLSVFLAGRVLTGL